MPRPVQAHYEEAAALARKTANAASLVKALTGLALLDESQQHDYGAANSHITEARRAASACPNRDCMLDALLYKSGIAERNKVAEYLVTGLAPRQPRLATRRPRYLQVSKAPMAGHHISPVVYAPSAALVPADLMMRK